MTELRTAELGDVDAICRFGEAHIRPHYTPLIGAAAAADQVRLWWSEPQIRAAVTSGLVIVAQAGEQLIGVGQRGRRGDDHVIYKLYVDPGHRGNGVGPRLLEALIKQLPGDAGRLFIEHFAANTRAGAFYEREGFAVDRVEPSPGGDPALGVVWRSRPVP
ncbi:GNAT family N-acetyltransferase [Amycolatopsis sp. NPDC059657]|uniref:GNAT family N-acetyltransferase n=1 Tax=Amycolatopsis sp. NPDC059657 TaxID=3346899 RepID=UPI00366B3D37